EIPWCSGARQDRLPRPGAWLIRLERISFKCVRNSHYSVVGCPVKKFWARSRPHRLEASGRRDLPFAAWARKWPYEDFASAWFLGCVGDPSAIWRKHGFGFTCRGTEERRRLAWFPAGRLIAFDRKDHDVVQATACFIERQVLSTRMERGGILHVRTFGQPLNFAGSIGKLPIQVRCTFRAG